MDYVVLNGVKSTDITGLLIQKLPPVVKPLIRTQIEEIDGRDGDIVTKLGYSAYNRKILACTNNFYLAVYIKGSKLCFLSLYTYHIEYTAGDMLTD